MISALFVLLSVLAPQPSLAQVGNSKPQAGPLISHSHPAASTTLQLEETAPRSKDGINKTQDPAKDIDAEITDNRLRSELGSKSKWSFKSTFTYSGSSVSDPFNGVRPNYRQSAAVEEMAFLKGAIGVNYRLNKNDSFSAGTGLTMIDPLHGDPSKPAADARTNRSGELARYEFATPYLSWNRGYRAGPYQMISSLMYTHPTTNNAALMKMSDTVNFTQMIQAQFAKKWSLSLNMTAIKFIYSGEIEDPSMVRLVRRGIIKRPDIAFTVLPYLQYAFSDRYSFRSGFNYFDFARYENSDDNIQLEPSQSVGLGISVTRDIYFFPHIEFTPKDIRADRTNVALMANINLF